MIYSSKSPGSVVLVDVREGASRDGTLKEYPDVHFRQLDVHEDRTIRVVLEYFYGPKKDRKAKQIERVYPISAEGWAEVQDELEIVRIKNRILVRSAEAMRLYKQRCLINTAT